MAAQRTPAELRQLAREISPKAWQAARDRAPKTISPATERSLRYLFTAGSTAGDDSPDMTVPRQP